MAQGPGQPRQERGEAGRRGAPRPCSAPAPWSSWLGSPLQLPERRGRGRLGTFLPLPLSGAAAGNQICFSALGLSPAVTLRSSTPDCSLLGKTRWPPPADPCVPHRPLSLGLEGALRPEQEASREFSVRSRSKESALFTCLKWIRTIHTLERLGS